MLHHIDDGEVIGVERVGEAAVGHCGEQPQGLCAGPGQRNPVAAAGLPARHGQDAQRERDEERQDQREMA